MKNLFFAVLFVLPFLAKSQDVALNDVDGVYVSYKLVKLKEDSKKDTYLLTCKALNKNDFDVYYLAPANKVNPFFSSLTVRNGNETLYFIGTESRLVTGNRVLFYLKKGGSYTLDKEIKVQKGVVPVLTNEFVSDLKPITDYR
nr:hypothetical protein [Pedobacter sp. ASV2]